MLLWSSFIDQILNKNACVESVTSDKSICAKVNNCYLTSLVPESAMQKTLFLMSLDIDVYIWGMLDTRVSRSVKKVLTFRRQNRSCCQSFKTIHETLVTGENKFRLTYVDSRSKILFIFCPSHFQAVSCNRYARWLSMFFISWRGSNLNYLQIPLV